MTAAPPTTPPAIAPALFVGMFSSIFVASVCDKKVVFLSLCHVFSLKMKLIGMQTVL